MNSEQLNKQEPKAWLVKEDGVTRLHWSKPEHGYEKCESLYTAPPKPAQDLIVGYADSYDLDRAGHDFWVSRQPGKNTVPLYLYGHPPKIWQGLTDEEVWDLYTDRGNIFARAIEDKLKEKNT